ncbi:putative pectinesterase inhibitor domain-containing protein [Medicago truncatula]|uniref:Pectinesterase inhibitor domain protein n=1 Tax=Medicago truncatula TaxID=3880 RepID=G7KP42_MEDTR|nr:pectinesterase inhibitor domain protein [Medicago truncatula]RHN50681.1 putative pectinesterase inhibitor domain-containing protein [Medicago truncatula]
MSRYFSLLLVLFILCVASSNSISAKVVDVDIICKEASNPTYCSNLLNSKSGGAKGVDLVDLAQYTIDVLNDNSSRAFDLMKNLMDIAENDTVASYYYRCDSDFLDTENSILLRLRDAELNLHNGKYPAMAKESDDIIQYLLDCIHSLQEHETSTLLAKYVDDLRQGAQVLQIISKYLNLGK